MSQISPPVMRGMAVLAVSGTISSRPGFGCGVDPAGGAVGVAVPVAWSVSSPSLTVRVTVRLPAAA